MDATHRLLRVTGCTQIQLFAPPTLRHLPRAHLLLMSLNQALEFGFVANEKLILLIYYTYNLRYQLDCGKILQQPQIQPQHYLFCGFERNKRPGCLWGLTACWHDWRLFSRCDCHCVINKWCPFSSINCRPLSSLRPSRRVDIKCDRFLVNWKAKQHIFLQICHFKDLTRG